MFFKSAAIAIAYARHVESIRWRTCHLQICDLLAQFTRSLLAVANDAACAVVTTEPARRGGCAVKDGLALPMRTSHRRVATSNSEHQTPVLS
jgi:hypothetical protein